MTVASCFRPPSCTSSCRMGGPMQRPCQELSQGLGRLHGQGAAFLGGDGGQGPTEGPQDEHCVRRR
eukprot:8307363-Lingulodinium_polyedra.AAC.1